jgi:hypothetical protein
MIFFALSLILYMQQYFAWSSLSYVAGCETIYDW